METMKHEFGGLYSSYCLNLFAYLFGCAKTWAPSHICSATLSCPQSLYNFISHTCLPLPSPSPAQQRRAEHSQPPYTHFNRQSKVQHVLQMVQINVQAGMHGLMGQKPTTPRMQTAKVVPNPPTLPAFLWSASLTSLLIITVVIGIWGLFLSKFCGWPWSTGSRALEEDRHAVKSRAKCSS